MQVGRIFTAISISSGGSSRQLSTRYTFHAGRNLPGKGLRYLRTLRVRAVVHWSLHLELTKWIGSPKAVDLPVLDRSQLLYIPYWGLQEPVFLLNSRLTSFVEGRCNIGQSILYNLRSAFLPNSLNNHYPFALVFSTSPPVSVCGTNYFLTPWFIFPGSLSHPTLPSCDRIVFVTRPDLRRNLLLNPPYRRVEISNFVINQVITPKNK